MNIRSVSLTLVLLFILVAVGQGQALVLSTGIRPQTLAQIPMPATASLSAVSQSVNQEPINLNVIAGRSVVVNSPQQLRRISVSDPSIASALIVNPNQVLINGLIPGRTTLLLWNEREQPSAYDLH